MRERFYATRQELVDYVRVEAQQRREEGFDVAPLAADLARIDAGEHLPVARLMSLYRAILRTRPWPDYPYVEPDDLAAIQAACLARPGSTAGPLEPHELFDRIHGGWLGRCCGCLLGKPVEAGWSRAKLKRYLELAGHYPLTGYVPLLSPLPEEFELNLSWPDSVRGQIDGMPRDDDTDYTVLNLMVLEDHGADFGTAAVSAAWLEHLPYHLVYTAERLAYRNLVLNVQPPATATYHNPCREWVGARIRADVFGYVAPGRPALAAELAYRDAVLSHTKNGVYTAMQTAAMIAQAFVSSDMHEIIEAGLATIPAQSRTAALTHQALELHAREHDWATACDLLLADYGGYNGIHALNNQAIVLLALLYGQADFANSVAIAVMCGLDTDSNGATVGSIVGVLTGAAHLPPIWTEPLHDRLATALSQCSGLHISDLAERTARVAQTMLAGEARP